MARITAEIFTKKDDDEGFEVEVNLDNVDVFEILVLLCSIVEETSVQTGLAEETVMRGIEHALTAHKEGA